MLSLILDDIERDDTGVVVLDPHGDLVKDIATRCSTKLAKRVSYFAPAEQRNLVLGLNPFELQDRKAYELQVGAIMDVFAHTWYGDFRNAPTMQNTLETSVRTMLAAYPAHRTSFLHLLLVTQISDVGEAWRKTLSLFVQHNPALAQNWKEWSNWKRLKPDLESSRQKVKHIITSDVLYPILCQPQSADCFRYQDVLARKGVILVNLNGLDDEGQRLIGSIILTQLTVMARLREKEKDRVPCHIYADEFYKFSPQSFVKIINELRKYGVFCTLAHQNREQLEDKARAASSSCGNIIVFQVNPEDSGALGQHFIAKGEPLPRHYLSSLDQFQALVRFEGVKGKRHQAPIRTYRERRQPNEKVLVNIREKSLEFGVPLQRVNDMIADAIMARGGYESNSRYNSKNLRTRRKSEDADE